MKHALKILNLLPFIIFIPIAVFYLLLLNPYWNPTWDSATYIMLGKSLITGHGFKYMDIPHTKYPFMFPLMLSPIVGIFGLDFFLMRLLIVLTGLGSIGLTFWIFRREFGTAFGFGIAIMTAASYPLIFECTRILSDVPYMFLSLLSLAFIRKYVKDDGWSNKYGYISAGLLLASFFTRYLGSALFAGFILYLVLEKKGKISFKAKKITIICLIFLIPASIWMIRGAVIRYVNPHPQDLREFLSYEKELVVVDASNPHSQILNMTSLTSRLKSNIQYYQDLATDIISGKDKSYKTLKSFITAILLCGFIYSLVRWRSVFEYYVFFYVLIYILWTSLQGTRFLVPIIPFLFYYFARALWLVIDLIIFFINSIFKQIKRFNYRIWVEWVVMVSLAGGMVYLNWNSDANIFRDEHRKPYYTGSTASYFEAIDWIKINTPPDAVVITDRAPYVYMLTERKTFTFPWVENVEEVIKSMIKNGADYIIMTPVGGYAQKYLAPALKYKPDYFLKVYEAGDCIIYKFLSRRLCVSKVSFILLSKKLQNVQVWCI